jgi:hypothetical protein
MHQGTHVKNRKMTERQDQRHKKTLEVRQGAKMIGLTKQDGVVERMKEYVEQIATRPKHTADGRSNQAVPWRPAR